MKISSQFFLSVLLLSGLAVYFLTDFVISELKPRLREEVEENLADSANLLSALLATQAANGKLNVELLQDVFSRVTETKLNAQIYDLLKTHVDLRVYVTDANGIVLFDSFTPSNLGKDFSSWRDVSLSLRDQYGARSTRDNEEDNRSGVLYVSAPVKSEGRIIGVVTAAKPTLSANFFMDRAKKKILRVTLIEALGIIILSTLMVVFVTLPVRRLTAYARAVRDGKPAALPKIRSADINELATAFEEMKTALAGKNYVAEYVQTLTHELKSPLAAIRGSAELLAEENLPPDKQRRFSANICSEANRLQSIIEKLLELASVEKQDSLETAERLDLLTLLEETIDALHSRLESKRLRIDWKERQSTNVIGDGFLLRQAIRNVVDNAIDFSPEGAAIECGCRKAKAGETNAGEIFIADSGPGIPDYALPRVYERFFSLPRPDSGQKSSGLGLSFVRQVVHLHEGKIEISNRTPSGTLVRIVLPQDRLNAASI